MERKLIAASVRIACDRVCSLTLLIGATLLAACTTDSDSSRDFQSDIRPSNQTCVAPMPAGDNALVSLEPVFGDAFADEHNKIVHAEYASQVDGGRWYFVRQEGQIYTLKPGEPRLELALDISDLLWTEHHEVGLLSVALDPQFEEQPYLYATYTVPTPNGEEEFASRVGRFKASSPSGSRFDPESELAFFDVPQPRGDHSGDHVAFGPDGYLYFSAGDGGGPSRNRANGQDTFTLKGAISRIDVRQPDERRGTTYSIPETNPYFFGVRGRPEIYAYGFRNPWRFSFDPENGELWVGDVGQDTREEINLVELDGNYGWPLKEGFTCFEASEPCPASELGLEDPVWDYPHAEGKSVTGGIVYRGSDVPTLDGQYLFADYINGNIWALKADEDGSLVSELLVQSGMLVTSFSYGPNNEAYVVRYRQGEAGPALYKIAPPEEPNREFPEKLSDTGCLQPSNPKLPAAGVVEYPIVAPLWSDGAEKKRFFAIPDNQAITVDDSGDLRFPEGTVMIKHFGFGGRLHETRLFIHHQTGWKGYTYEWNEAQTDAQLLRTSKMVILANGKTWTYPTRGDCATCHTEAAGHTLGPELRQFSGQPVPERTRALIEDDASHEGDFVSWLVENEYLYPEYDLQRVRTLEGKVMEAPTSDGQIDRRARSYLHSNCSGCHRAGGTGRVDMDLSMMVSLEEMNVCDKPVEAGALFQNIPDFKVVDPGDPMNSSLYRRMQVRNLFQMPPLASHVVDEEGSGVIRQWIEAMDDECHSDEQGKAVKTKE
jgi:uncharacterized repeat protein (TIGR03806 family)